MGFAGSSRPERFATAKGTGHALEILRRVFEGNSTKLLMGSQVVSKSIFKIVGPGQFDYVNLGQAGIYELSATGLRTSLAARGDERPADFSSHPSANGTVTEWKRAK